jgi:hypothetical protein
VKEMPLQRKTVSNALTRKYNIKVDHVSDKGNLVCKKLSKKTLAALRADGYMVKVLPSGSYVICKKK